MIRVKWFDYHMQFFNFGVSKTSQYRHTDCDFTLQVTALTAAVSDRQYEGAKKNLLAARNYLVAALVVLIFLSPIIAYVMACFIGAAIISCILSSNRW